MWFTVFGLLLILTVSVWVLADETTSRVRGEEPLLDRWMEERHEGR